jgi:hypothetical protein
MSRIFSEFKYPLIFGMATVLLIIGMLHCWLPDDQLCLGAYLLSIVFAYGAFVLFIIHYLESFDTNRQTLTIFVFSGSAVVLIGLFSIAWGVFQAFQVTSDLVVPVSPYICHSGFDVDLTWASLYFSTTVFTTLGFGDYIPKGQAGQVISIVESLLGVTHVVTFFSILMTRLKPSET